MSIAKTGTLCPAPGQNGTNDMSRSGTKRDTLLKECPVSRWMSRSKECPALPHLLIKFSLAMKDEPIDA